MPFQRYPGAPESQKLIWSSATVSRRAAIERSCCSSAAVATASGGGGSLSWLPDVSTHVFQRPAEGSTSAAGAFGDAARDVPLLNNVATMSSVKVGAPLANLMGSPPWRNASALADRIGCLSARSGDGQDACRLPSIRCPLQHQVHEEPGL